MGSQDGLCVRDRMKEAVRHYFVDEAGDTTLFSKKGKVIIGNEGCSNYFIVGTAHIENPPEVRQEIIGLRRKLLADPYFANVPSVQHATGKTALHFHSKDDVPEVRREVFRLLMQQPIRVWAVVRRKQALLQYVKSQNMRDPSWRYNQNAVYDSCIKRLFKDRLHRANTNVICFSKRGKAPRNAAMKRALDKAIANFERTHAKEVATCCEVISNRPKEEPCLQAIDYFLWALQRLYEKGEPRYFDYVREKFELIIDADDKRIKPYGMYYDRRTSLTVEKIKRSLRS